MGSLPIKLVETIIKDTNMENTGKQQPRNGKLPIHSVSASMVIKELHEALTNLLQATDDEGWNCDGKDWEEQEQARKALANTPSKYLHNTRI